MGVPGFEVEEEAFGISTIKAGIATDGTISTHHTMAGDDDGDGVAAIGLADRARAGGEGAGDVTIGAGFARRYLLQRGPDTALKGRAMRCERKLEMPALAVEIILQLFGGVAQQGRGLLLRHPAPIKGHDGAILLGEGEVAQRCE